jgi:arylsulfatase A-like enzyme
MKNLKRREVVSLLVGVYLAAIILLTGCESDLAVSDTQPEKNPNIIFLLTDDQRWDTIGYAGNSIIQTPNMDDLAQNGVRFANAFVTTSMCAPSRVSILTGQWERRHGIVDNETNLSQDMLGQTYPMLLRQAGYKVAFVGRYGIGTKEGLPIDEYDFWRGFAGNGTYENRDKDGKYKHLTQIIGEQAIEFLQSCTVDKPFYLSINFKAPQCRDGGPRQFDFDPAYKDLYTDVTIPTPEATDRDYFEALPIFLHDSEARELWYQRFMTQEMFQESVKSYYRLITGVDTMIGKIREQLEKLGLDDNTIIILTSDNGMYLGEFGLAEKWFPHEVSIRVPLVLFDPRADEKQQGVTVEQMVLNVDIAPTILELAGLVVPKTMQGQSVLLLLKETSFLSFLQGRKWRKDFFYEELYENPKIPRTEALRTESRKYIRYIDYEFEQLYDLEHDPNETINLAGDDKYQKTLESLRKRCDKLAEEVKAEQ